MKKALIISALLFYYQAVQAQTTGTMTDPRDGQTYKTVRISSLIWMAENLNYENENSYCYENNSGNCDKYGRLYTWEAAKKACPRGWHLASDGEWSILVNEFGGDNAAGKALKAEKVWYFDGSTNSSGFNGLPAGYRNTDGS